MGKRKFPIMLAIAIAILVIPFTAQSVNASVNDSSYNSIGTPTTIRVGDTLTASASSSVGAWFEFTPVEDNEYYFQSTGSNDTYGALYEKVDGVYKKLTSDDDSGSGNNFKITYSLKAGKKYYYVASLYSGGTTSFSVSLTEHIHNWVEGSTTYEKNDAETHYVTKDFHCNCGATKAEERLQTEAHDWQYSGNRIEANNTDTHMIVKTYECKKCGEEKTETSYEAHDWYKVGYDKVEYYNSSKHKVTSTHRCYDCGEEKTETTYTEHELVWDWKDENGYHEIDEGDDAYSYYNGSKHKVFKSLYCEDCKRLVTRVSYENHTDTGGCYDCTFPKGNATLKSGTWKYFSGRPYLKVVVSKPGYIKVQGNDSGYLYNFKKKKFSDEYYYGDYTTYFAVKKGTYYLRSNYDDNSRIKYTFVSVPKQKNSSKKTAVKVKPGKYKNQVVYKSSKTRKRWYKINVSSKHRLYFWKTGDIETPYLCDSKGNVIQWFDYLDDSGQYSKYVTDKKVKKGTYYLVFEYYGDSYATRQHITGYAGKFKWK